MINSQTVSLAVCGILNEATALSDVTVLTAFTPYEKKFPLKNKTVSVGVDSFKETKGNVYSSDHSQLLYNRATDIRIGFDIYVPTVLFGHSCHGVFDTIGNLLMDNNSLYNYVSAGCGSVSYQREENALLLHGWVDIEIRRTV